MSLRQSGRCVAKAAKCSMRSEGFGGKRGMPSWCDPRLALTPVQAEESAADDIVFDLGPQDETVRARAKANSGQPFRL